MNKSIRKIVEEGYDRGDYAKVFRASTKLNSFEQRLFKMLLQYIPPEAAILDLGSGTGVPYDRFLVDKGCKVTGIDLSQKHIDSAIENVPEATYIKGDFSNLEFSEGSFDAIISLYAIFHIPRTEHAALFRQMHLLLKQKGVILISLGTSDSEYGEENNWCGIKMAWSTYAPQKYEEILADSGFAILDSAFEGEYGSDEYHFWVLASKA